MSINNNPTINQNSGYFIAPSRNGMTGKETSKQIVEHNQRTLSNYDRETTQNLTTLKTVQTHTVSTYGTEGKNFFGRIIQRIKNLFHLSEYLEKDTRATVDKMMESAKQLRMSLNFKFKPEDLKELPTESFDEAIGTMEQLASKMEDSANSIEILALEQLTKQIKDIVIQLKNLKLYAVENKIVQSLKDGNIEDAYEEIQTINQLYPEDPKTEKGFSSTLNFEETETKYSQMLEFQFVLDKLNELNGENPIQTFGWAHQTWADAKKTLRNDCKESELSKLLEQRLDERYTQRIKTLSPDIQALENGVSKGTEVTQQNLDMARALCRTGSGTYTNEKLSTYVEELAKSVTLKK